MADKKAFCVECERLVKSNYSLRRDLDVTVQHLARANEQYSELLDKHLALSEKYLAVAEKYAAALEKLNG